MKAIGRICSVGVLVLALTAWADDEDAKPRKDEKEEASARVVYVPPSRGATRTRTGGGTRGPLAAPTVAALAPDHVGVTNRAQPTLAWFVSEATDARVDFTLIDPDAVEPLLETTIESPAEAGVQLVRLSNLGVELEEGRSYDWAIALVLDPDARDLDVVAGGAIRRDPAAPGTASQATPGSASYLALARAGVWYDALADLSDAIAANPGNAALREARADLLEQVGVGAAAAYERGGARGGSGVE
ncbi:MAG: DUF928 domain-containing protein [Myxococcota bacterium]